MTVKVLAENTAVSDQFGSEHGLSLLIETRGRKVLFDTGKGELFLRTAETLGERIGEVEIAVLSHGHYDHGGGLPAFMRENAAAPIYAHKQAFERHTSARPAGMADIGLDTALLRSGRFVFTEGYGPIAPGLEVFSDVTGNELAPKFNASLFMERGGKPVPDDFAHEQNLIITEGDRLVLIAGCAHRGILNIVERFKAHKGRYPDTVIGGFHLSNSATKESEPPERVRALAARLLETGAKYFTCHCTGLLAYGDLKAAMRDQIGYLATGAVAQI